MRPIEPLRNAQHAGQRAHQAPIGPFEPGECRMTLFRKGLAMIASHAGDDLELALCEALQVAVENEMIGVLVVLRVIDHVPDVVQQRRGLEQLARIGRHSEPLRQSVEQLRRELGDVLTMPLTRPALPRECSRGLEPADRPCRLARLGGETLLDHREQQTVA